MGTSGEMLPHCHTAQSAFEQHTHRPRQGRLRTANAAYSDCRTLLAVRHVQHSRIVTLGKTAPIDDRL